MIGKSDLGKAVKLLVDLGMYEAMFGVKSKINNFDKFKKANNVGEMAYMMFEEQPSELIIKLIEDNITNNKKHVSYAKVLNDYHNIDPTLSLGDRIYELSLLYKENKDALLNSSYINSKDRAVAKLFDSGQLLKDEKGVALDGHAIGEIIDKAGGSKIKTSEAKKFAQKAIYNSEIVNKPEVIKSFLENNLDSWLY